MKASRIRIRRLNEGENLRVAVGDGINVALHRSWNGKQKHCFHFEEKIKALLSCEDNVPLPISNAIQIGTQLINSLCSTTL